MPRGHAAAGPLVTCAPAMSPDFARRAVCGWRPRFSPAPVTAQAGPPGSQVANELAPVATVTLASRHPVRFIPQRLGGQDVHYWLRETGFDTLPAEWLSKITGGGVVTDSVGFQQTLADGLVDRRPMFTSLDQDKVVWSDGQREPVDAIILAFDLSQPTVSHHLKVLRQAWSAPSAMGCGPTITSSPTP